MNSYRPGERPRSFLQERFHMTVVLSGPFVITSSTLFYEIAWTLWISLYYYIIISKQEEDELWEYYYAVPDFWHHPPHAALFVMAGQGGGPAHFSDSPDGTRDTNVRRNQLVPLCG
jgi:hypothetical protein